MAGSKTHSTLNARIARKKTPSLGSDGMVSQADGAGAKEEAGAAAAENPAGIGSGGGHDGDDKSLIRLQADSRDVPACRDGGDESANVSHPEKAHRLLRKRRPHKAEAYQAAKLWELLPRQPNDLWQMDVTYVHIPGFGWWYVVTAIDYFSRYLLAARLTASYSAQEVIDALREAREESERLQGPLVRVPFLVTDNGPSFLAKRFCAHLTNRYQHVRIQYRTPQQLGLLERFHKTLKTEEVYWRLYENPAHARQWFMTIEIADTVA
jgi:transposase InsO family protein